MHRHARPRRVRDPPVRPRPGHPLRLLRRRGPQPRHRRGPPGRRPARRARPGRDPRLLRRRRRAHRPRTRPLRAAALRRGAVAAHRQVARHRRRSRIQHPGAHLGAPHRRGQRHRRRLPRPRQQDDHPVLRDGEAVLPAGRRPGPRAHPGRGRRLGARPVARGRPARDHLQPGHPPLPHPARPPRPPVGRPRDGPRLRQTGAVHPRGRIGTGRRPPGRPRRTGALPRHLRPVRRLARPRREGRAGPAAQGRRDQRPPLGRPRRALAARP